MAERSQDHARLPLAAARGPGRTDPPPCARGRPSTVRARGYAGTTVAAVADAAAVSPETIYLSLGGKRGLLEGVMEITGPHETAATDETWWQMVADLPTAAERLAKNVEYSCRILARTRPIHAIIRGAADKEAFAAALGRQLLQERLADQTERIRRFLADDLRPGLSVTEAGERYCALASPDLYNLLTVEPAGPPSSTATGSPTCSPTNCSADAADCGQDHGWRTTTWLRCLVSSWPPR